MNTVVDGDAQDLELLFARIDELEGLVKRQKEFINHSGDTWRRLLNEEQDRSRSTAEEHKRIEAEARRLSALDSERLAVIDELEMRLSKIPERQNEESERLRNENESLNSKLRVLEEETSRRLSSLENVREELQRQVDARSHLEGFVDRAKALEQKLAAVESELRQRQEEIEQTRAALENRLQHVAKLELELSDAKARESSLKEALEDANGWVFRLAGERRENEKQLDRLARDRDAKSRALEAALLQVARLSVAVDELNSQARERTERFEEPTPTPAAAAEAFSEQAAVLEPETANLLIEIEREPAVVRQEPTEALPSAPVSPAPRSAPTHNEGHAQLMQAVNLRDKQQLLRKLQVIPDGRTDVREDVQPSISAVSEQVLAEIAPPPRTTPMPILVSARNNELERKLREARDQAEWLLRLNVILLGFPKRWWWKLAPVGWRRKRLLELLQREGLFDGAAYLGRYTDVGDAGVDPLAHYLTHGLIEGRVR